MHTALLHTAVGSPRKGVVQMGHGRWTNVLRFVVCSIIALALMILITQKRVDRTAGTRAVNIELR